MRLSDERLNALELACAVGACSAEVTGSDLCALIAEVRALRGCEKALELLIERIPPDADPFESGDLWIGAGGIIAARTALAGVRALEGRS